MAFSPSSSSPSTGNVSSKLDLRRLVVEVIDANGLLPCTSAGDSNPHLSICLLDLASREIKTESFKAVPQFKTLSPVWNAKFEFGKKFWSGLKLSSVKLVNPIINSR